MAFGWDQFRGLLRESGYTRSALGAIGAFTGKPIDRDAAEKMTEQVTARNVLLRVFFLRIPVAGAQARAVLGEETVAGLLTLGMLLEEGAGVVGAFAVVPIGGLYTLRDFEPEETGRPLRSDHVLGVGLASSIASTLTVRGEGERVLDIGCGQGFQSLVAAGHAARVIGTDINPRALWVADAAAKLNGITNIELREGSLYEPVKNEAPFDLIVSNPPFLIAPPHDLMCLGSDFEGDALVEALVRGAGARLAEGGFCCMTCNWHHRSEEDWVQRPRQWVGGGGCDVWLIRLSHDGREEYAKKWIHEAGRDREDGARIDFEQWMRYFDSLGIGMVSMGMMIMRKRTGTNWFRAQELKIDHCDGEAGDQIRRIFRNQTLVNEHPGAAAAELVLAMIAKHELLDRLQCTPGRGWGFLDARLRQTEGFEFEVKLDSHAVQMLGRLDGVRPASTVIAELAQELGADPRGAVSHSGAFLSTMMTLGFLEAR